MKNLKKGMAFLIAMCMLSTTLMACQKTDEPEPVVEPSSQVESAEEEEKPDDPLTPSEPVTLTTALRTTPEDTFPMDGTSSWHKKYAEHGINVEVAWTADASQYDTKMNTIIAAGDLPDIMQVSQPLSSLIKGDLVADMTDALDTYLLPNLKEDMFGPIGKEAMDAVTFDGKVRFIPTNITTNQANAFPLFIRTDWLKTLNMELPKTLDDLKEIALAFTKNDPDKNGKKDTYGFAITGQSNLVEDWGGLYGFFPAYGIQPCTWYDGMLFYSKDEDGKAVWDGTKPEVKEGLQWLADLYKEGAIPKDFTTMDTAQITADLNGGKAGLVFGVRGLPHWAINNTIKTNPDAEWYAMNMPTKDGSSEPPIFGWQPVNTAVAISSKCKNLEAVVKAMNISWTYGNGDSDKFIPDLTDETKIRTESGNALISAYEADKEGKDAEKLFDALESNDTSKLDAGSKNLYDNIRKYEETKDPECWGAWNARSARPGSAWYLVWHENKPEMIKRNLYWAMPSENMEAKLPLFKKMEEETIVKIITGNADVSEWDKMVENWNKVGGDSITQEVNDFIK